MLVLFQRGTKRPVQWLGVVLETTKVIRRKALHIYQLIDGGSEGWFEGVLTINVPVVYMGRYKVVLRGDYP
jgi:hypothetical protein